MTPLEAAAKALWEKHADEPLQVGKWKEPTDYREFVHLSDSARVKVRGFARAAISACLKACAENDTVARIMCERVRSATNGKYRWDDPLETTDRGAFWVDKAYWRQAAREACDDILSAMERQE